MAPVPPTPPPPAVTIIFGVRQKDIKEPNSGWRGVLIGHWNSLDLAAVKMSNAVRTPPVYSGYVYDPQLDYQDIVLTEIEGRLLECDLVSENLKGWRSRSGSPRTDGYKLNLMIDDQAKNGDRPAYSGGQLAFPVGFATWSLKRTDWPAKGQDKVSPMLMRLIFRDSIIPPWGEWKDPDNVTCELLSMYFITGFDIKGITQDRPHYKFKIPPPPVNLGVPEFNKPVALPPKLNPSRMVASSRMVSSKMAARQPEHTGAIGDHSDLPTQPVEPGKAKDFEDNPFDSETLAEIEKEMDAEPGAEPGEPEPVPEVYEITLESGEKLIL